MRFEHDPLSHRITEGEPVKLFRYDEEADGIAVCISSAAIDVVDDYPDWNEEGKIRLEASFPDLTWRCVSPYSRCLRPKIKKERKGSEPDFVIGFLVIQSFRLLPQNWSHTVRMG